jgi:uncharacterized protein (DUF4415 family)
MGRKEHIVSYTEAEIKERLRTRGSLSNWEKSAKKTMAEVEAEIAADPDEAGWVTDWASASFEMPQPKSVLNMRIDKDILDYFRKTGKGYQTLINAVLRSYVEQKEHPRRRN